MFRRIITQRHLSYYSTSASLPFAPLLLHSKHTPFLNTQNPNPSLPSNSPSPTPLSDNSSLTNTKFTLFPSSDRGNYESIVNRYQYSSSHEDSNQLHLQIFKNGYTCDVFLLNTLVNIYTRIAEMVPARKVFDEMPLRNSISWACLISGYTRNNMPNEACTVFREMICKGFPPVHYAIGSVLRACQGLESHGLRFGLQIHGFVSKTLNVFHEVVCNGLISMYGKCMDSPDYAIRVFDEMGSRSLVSWNSVISVCSHRGDADASYAFKLLSGMQVEGLQPTEYTFGSVITAASTLSETDPFLLEQVMCTIQKSGFLFDLYVGSALVSGFARTGRISLAKKIFELMDVKNAVSMHGLMVGLTRQKHGEDAVEVFKNTKAFVKVTSDSYVMLLSAATEFFDIEEGGKTGKAVHGYVIRNRLSDTNVAVGNSLINMYAKCGSVNNAYSVFRLMGNKDEVSWNSVITGFDQNCCFVDAVTMFCEMRRNFCKPGSFTLVSALSSCAGSGFFRLGEQLHCEGVKLGLDTNVSVSNALIDFYSETGCVTNCKKVFSMMREHDQVSWNSIIGAVSGSNSLVQESVEYFIEMMRDGLCPNLITFVSILGGVLSSNEVVRQIHALLLKYPFANETVVENAIFMSYGKCGNTVDCEMVFSKMGDRRDETSWNSMISGYIHNEELSKAIGLVKLMLTDGQRLDRFTLASVLSACASVATLERGMEVHACALRAYMDADVVIGSALVDMYSKCGRIDYASRFFESMRVKNVYSWNSMISGYARHGFGNESLKTFHKMKLEGYVPDHVTFVGVLSACSHIGLVDQGFDHFNSMSEVYGLSPKTEHFSCMVDLFGRAGELDKIEEFLNKMVISPSVLIWRTVLGACCRSSSERAINLGIRAGSKLLELDPNNAVNYVLLSNMYAVKGKWEEMRKTRFLMNLADVKKEVGCSWVSMKDGVHVFVACDKSHPEVSRIYKKVHELQGRMREMGYVPEIRYALRDLEVENQEEVLSYHSEKLAVAFVLTRKSELPIRIMKNLRVCGDCHTFLKYVSKIVGRLIVVRDSNRFHHFVDGNCSCGDYW